MNFIFSKPPHRKITKMLKCQGKGNGDTAYDLYQCTASQGDPRLSLRGLPTNVSICSKNVLYEYVF